LEKLNELDADEQADICESLTTTLMSFTAAASRVSVMTVKTSDTCSSGDGHSLSVSGCREQTSPSGGASAAVRVGRSHDPVKRSDSGSVYWLNYAASEQIVLRVHHCGV